MNTAHAFERELTFRGSARFNVDALPVRGLHLGHLMHDLGCDFGRSQCREFRWRFPKQDLSDRQGRVRDRIQIVAAFKGDDHLAASQSAQHVRHMTVRRRSDQTLAELVSFCRIESSRNNHQIGRKLVCDGHDDFLESVQIVRIAKSRSRPWDVDRLAEARGFADHI